MRAHSVSRNCSAVRQRHDGHAADFHRVQLLETVQGARCRVLFQVGDRADGDQPVTRPFHIGVLQLRGVQARAAFQLGNDLVAAAGEIKAVHIVAADQSPQI